MAEYIDRSAGVSIFRAKANMAVLVDAAPYFEKAAQMLEQLPAADVTEVVHAQWEEADWREYDAQSCETIRYPKAAIVCTNCRCAFKKDALWGRNFCPNCGAEINPTSSATYVNVRSAFLEESPDICKAPFVTGKEPGLSEDGCIDYCFKDVL